MHIKRAVICILSLAALLLAGCTPGSSVPGPGFSQAPAESSAPAPTREPAPEDTPSLSPEPDPPITPEPAPQASEVPYPAYEFGACLEESEPVEDDAWFDDAVFLGDSRTEGLQLWGGIRTGDYYWKRGISVFGVDSEVYTFDVDGESVTMVGALGKREYGKVYIMMGVNELGYPASSYETGLAKFLDQVIAAQPNAVIYLQTLPPLNDELAAKYLADYERNANVDAFNEAIVRVAAEKRVVLLNTAEVYRGEDGQLPAEMTSDGCHFQMGGYAVWADYLRCHTIDPQRYFYWRDAAEPAESESPE